MEPTSTSIGIKIEDEEYGDYKIENYLDIGPTVLQNASSANFRNLALDKEMQMQSEELVNIKTEDELLNKKLINNENNNCEINNYLRASKMVKIENDIKLELNEEDDNHDAGFINTKYSCEICQFYLSSLSSLRDHMQRHVNIFKETKDKKKVNKDFNENRLTKDNDDRSQDKKNTREKILNLRKKHFITEKNNRDIEKNTEKKLKMKENNLATKKESRFTEKNVKTGNNELAKEKDGRFKDKEKNTENTLKTRKKYIVKGKVERNEDKEKTTEKKVKTRKNNVGKEKSEKFKNKEIITQRITRKTSQETVRFNDKNRFHEKFFINTKNYDKANDKIEKQFVESQHDADVDGFDEQNKENSPEDLNDKGSSKEVQFSKKFTCDICPRSYTAYYTLTKHMRREHLGITSHVYCNLCSKKYCRTEYLVLHMKQVHLGIKKSFLCEFCGQKLCDKSALRRHKLHWCPETRNRHTVTKTTANLTCKVCKKKFLTMEVFENHMANHPKFICDYCDRNFYLKYYLVAHIKREHFKLRNRCHLCGKEYVTQYNLKKHLRKKCHSLMSKVKKRKA